jgi:hypothetical protein
MVIPRDSRGSVESGARRKIIKKYEPKNATIPAKNKKKDDRYRTAGAGKNPHGVRVVRSFVTTWTWPPSMCAHPIGSITREDLLLPFSFFPFATLSALQQQFFFFNCVSLYFRPSRGQSRVLIS